MKILITDLWPKEAHRSLNTMLITSLARYADVTVISINDYYKKNDTLFKKLNISCVDVYANEKTGRIGTRVYCLQLQKITNKIIKNSIFDCAICMSYETTCLPLSAGVYSRIPTILCEHSNLDDLQKKVKRFIAKKLIKTCYHLVFEKEFKNWMVNELSVQEQKVFVVAHPITLEHDDCESSDRYDCVGLCNANDDLFIQEIITCCETNHLSNLKMAFRSKKLVSKNDNINIISSFLDRDEYRSYYRDTKCVFVATPSNYQNRLSASIYDAISYNKIAYTTNRTLSKLYSNQYPGICVYVSSGKELIDILTNGKENTENLDEMFDKFKEDHSAKSFDCQVKKMLNVFSEILFGKETTNESISN
ncbi:MAG: hypothetical protein IJ353_02245 [Lachnospiraceae bacterium]|nr:hypothetical protein [Lachnospiraceae bacterium]